MLPLTEDVRRFLRVASATLCALPLCLAPLAGHASYDPGRSERRIPPAHAALAGDPWDAPPVVVYRDPFKAEMEGGSARSPLRGRGSVPAQAAAIVQGVIDGTDPRALVREATGSRIVSVGDPLEGSTIVGIDRTGVHLSDGKTLPLDRGQ